MLEAQATLEEKLAEARKLMDEAKQMLDKVGLDMYFEVIIKAQKTRVELVLVEDLEKPDKT